MWGSKKYYVDKVGQLYEFAIVLFFFTTCTEYKLL